MDQKRKKKMQVIEICVHGNQEELTPGVNFMPLETKRK